jgi:hypothetical protein
VVFITWWVYFHKQSHIQYNIENFLLVHNYLKRCLYKIVSKQIQPKKTNANFNKKVNIYEIENGLVDISKQLTKGLGNYVRGDEIFKRMKQNLNNNIIDIFVFPDTLINRSKVKYYRHIIEKVYCLLETDVPVLDDEAEYKALLENMSIIEEN